MEFDFEDLDNVRTTVEKLGRKILYIGKVASGQGGMEDIVEESKEIFGDCMADDFNTPKAIGELVRYTDLVYERAASGNTPSNKAYVDLLELWNVMKIFTGTEYLQLKEEQAPSGTVWLSDSKRRELAFIDALLEVREEERRRGNYEMADRIRARLLELGVVVEDTPSGPRWHYAWL